LRVVVDDQNMRLDSLRHTDSPRPDTMTLAFAV